MNQVEIYRKMLEFYRRYLGVFPQTRLSELLAARYGVACLESLSARQLDDLIAYFDGVLSGGAA